MPVRLACRYKEEELVGTNVRVLMPPPYSTQHDSFLRKYDRTADLKVVGCKRRVPVVDKAGGQSTAVLAVEERVDPTDVANGVFIGQLTFGTQTGESDPALTLQVWACRGFNSGKEGGIDRDPPPQGIFRLLENQMGGGLLPLPPRPKGP